MSHIINTRVAIIEDEILVANRLRRIITELGAICVGIAAHENKAIELILQEEPELVFMDIYLKKGGSGIAAARSILEQLNTAVVYTTAYDDDQTIAEAIEIAPYGYITKPYSAIDIKTASEAALARIRIEERMGQNSPIEVTLESTKSSTEDLEHHGTIVYNKEKQQLHTTFSDAITRKLMLPKVLSIDEFSILFSMDAQHIFLDQLQNTDQCQFPLFLKNNNSHHSAWCSIKLILQKNKVEHIESSSSMISLQNTSPFSDLIFKHLKIPVAMMNDTREITECNPSFLILTGYSYEQCIQRPIQTLFPEIGESTFPTSLCNDAEPETPTFKVSLQTGQGNRIPCELNIKPILDAAGKKSYILTLTDMRSLNKKDNDFKNITYYDQITECGNRHLFTQKMATISEFPTLFSIIFCDINKLNFINNNYGHEAGDAVIIETAARLKKSAGSKASVFRNGGDEFIILLEDTMDIAYAIAEQAILEFHHPIHVNGHSFHTSISIGIASNVDSSPKDVLRQADIAMYHSKKTGPGSIVCFSPNLPVEGTHHLFIEQGLREALEQNAIRAYFQPIIGTNGRIRSIEALCRWRCGDSGYVSPLRFIQVAEETQLIHKLGLQILKEACMALSVLDSLDFTSLTLHLNISIIQLTRQTFIEEMLTIINQFELSTNRFVLEINETALYSMSTRTILSRLKSLGFDIAIDNFGSGYTAVPQLGFEHYDHIKFDRSLISKTETQDSNHVLIKNMLNLCQDLRKTIFIEGIETKNQMQFAKDHQVAGQQGFFFSEPLPLNDLIQFIENEHHTNHCSEV